MEKFYCISITHSWLLLLSTSKESFAENGNHGLKWALEIADSVRDVSMPEAKLEEILGSVDADGEITESEYTNEWTFYYFLQSGESYEALGVTVYYDGSTFSWDHQKIKFEEIIKLKNQLELKF